MRKFYSPLRYPGGKAKILRFMKELIACNKFSSKPVYVEPYAGGAAVALGLLIEGDVSEIYINDNDPAIYSFWEYCIKQESARFIRKIKSINVDIVEWHKQVAIYKKGKVSFELGFAAFFLNRCNRSGIIKAGPIGGLSQSGIYKINCRFNKNDLISRIKIIVGLKDKIHIYGEDTKTLLQRADLQKVFKNCLLYLDPPYYKKGRQLYKNFYNHDDHTDIAKIMKKLNGQWVVSYDNKTEIKDLYKWVGAERTKEFNLTYFAGFKTGARQKDGQEIMFFSKSLKSIPALSFIG
jgi:DNA adenine methylase